MKKVRLIHYSDKEMPTLSPGRDYVVLNETETTYTIEDSKGFTHTFPKHYFVDALDVIKVTYEGDNTSHLTYGKVYDVLKEVNDLYYLVDDHGLVRAYERRGFVDMGRTWFYAKCKVPGIAGIEYGHVYEVGYVYADTYSVVNDDREYVEYSADYFEYVGEPKVAKYVVCLDDIRLEGMLSPGNIYKVLYETLSKYLVVNDKNVVREYPKNWFMSADIDEVLFKVACIEDGQDGLTKGKTYDVFGVADGKYHIVNDYQQLQSYPHTFFELAEVVKVVKKVVCEDDRFESGLTVRKIYPVVKNCNQGYLILNDHGVAVYTDPANYRDLPGGNTMSSEEPSNQDVHTFIINYPDQDGNMQKITISTATDPCRFDAFMVKSKHGMTEITLIGRGQ